MAYTDVHELINEDAQKHSPRGYATSKLWDDSRVRMVKLSISSEELLSLNTTALDLVDAPGDDKVIVPISVYAKYTHVSTAYTFGGNINISLFGVGSRISLSSALITSASNQYTQNSTISTITGSSHANKKYIVQATANPTLGDGTLEIWFHYRIIDLTLT